MPGPFKITFQEKGDVIVIRITGKMHGCPNFEEILYDPVNEYLDNGIRKFVVNMSRVRFITSIGVGFINTIYMSIRNDGGKFALCEMNERVLGVFHVAELDRFYTRFDSCEEAVASLKD